LEATEKLAKKGDQETSAQDSQKTEPKQGV